VGQVVLRMLRMSEPRQSLSTDGCQDLSSCSIPVHCRGLGAGAEPRRHGSQGVFPIARLHSIPGESFYSS